MTTAQLKKPLSYEQLNRKLTQAYSLLEDIEDMVYVKNDSEKKTDSVVSADLFKQIIFR